MAPKTRKERGRSASPSRARSKSPSRRKSAAASPSEPAPEETAATRGKSPARKSPTAGGKAATKKKGAAVFADVHTAGAPSASLLSSEGKAQGNYSGFVNLALLLLILTNVKEVVDNVLKYGSLVSVSALVVDDVTRWPGLLTGATLLLVPLLQNALERLALDGAVGEGFAAAATGGNLCLLGLAWPLYAVGHLFRPGISFAAGVVVMLCASTLFFKMLSYSAVNRALRAAGRGADANVSLRHLGAFLAYPTLCYQLAYPRAKGGVRWLWLARRVAVALFLSGLVLLFSQQYVLPCVANTHALAVGQRFPPAKVASRLLKCSVPNLYVWLAGFFIYFHLALNIIAELTGFADRAFYGPFWNATTLAYFWREWNKPVHNFVNRHVYRPIRRAGHSRTVALAVAFAGSAAFHELIVSAPFGRPTWYAFAGMMVQAALIQVVDPLTEGKTFGNVFFWMTITIGQPLAVLLVYRDWQIEMAMAGAALV